MMPATCRQQLVPVILGPTAVGKTAVAIELALRYGWEIVSCDSRQVYRYMDIGTAKPDKDELRAVRHYLIDIIDPCEQYSAWRFASDALGCAKKTAAKAKSICICGGTGLYFRCLSEGLGPQIPANPAFRAHCEQKADRYGKQVLHEELSRVDPLSAKRLHPNDSQRIIRALQVFYDTGESISRLDSQKKPMHSLEFVPIILHMPRAVLYERINGRAEQMMDMGLWDEFKRLRSMGYAPDSPGMHCVGYRELFAVENGEMSLPEAVEKIKRNTRRYAKRQMTWFRHQVSGFFVDVTCPESYTELIEYCDALWASKSIT
ncbi:MAG: tRNA (adenosine(37)-N6)-dimethylallyltransferase MiaA [Chitinispirillaceae bacterium]